MTIRNTAGALMSTALAVGVTIIIMGSIAAHVPCIAWRHWRRAKR